MNSAAFLENDNKFSIETPCLNKLTRQSRKNIDNLSSRFPQHCRIDD